MRMNKIKKQANDEVKGIKGKIKSKGVEKKWAQFFERCIESCIESS